MSSVSAVSLWQSSRISVSHTGDLSAAIIFFKNKIIFVPEFTEFDENI